MPPLPTPEEWARIRHEYEHTRRTVEDICLAYRISANTLRRRVRLWGWTMRHPPIGEQGPKAAMPPEETSAEEMPALDPRFRGDERGESPEPSPHIGEPPDARPASERLQGAAARVLPAIEATLARLAHEPVRPREMELAARALASLMRTLRELNGLLAEHKAETPQRSTEELRASVMRKLQGIVARREGDPPPEDMDEFRNELARRLKAVVERHEAQIPAKYEAAWHEFAAEAKRG